MANEKQVELVEGTSPVILTGLLILLVLFVSYMVKPPANAEVWFHDNVFEVSTILDLIHQGNYGAILPMLFYSNFVTINWWQSLFSIYFLFTFGTSLETRLGPARFILLVALGATIPWIVQYWDILNNPVWPIYFEHPKMSTYFFGPVYILFVLVSAYVVIIPKKATRELYIMQTDKSRSSREALRAKEKPLTEQFGLPWEVFISGFVIYEVVQRGFMIFPWKDLDTMNLYAVIASLIIGRVFAVSVLSGLKETHRDHPLKHEAIKRYDDMLDLDVSSENAIKGTAKALGLPPDQVRTWIAQSKGKLRTK